MLYTDNSSDLYIYLWVWFGEMKAWLISAEIVELSVCPIESICQSIDKTEPSRLKLLSSSSTSPSSSSCEQLGEEFSLPCFALLLWSSSQRVSPGQRQLMIRRIQQIQIISSRFLPTTGAQFEISMTLPSGSKKKSWWIPVFAGDSVL